MPRILFPLAVLAMLTVATQSVDAGAMKHTQPSLSAAHIATLVPTGAPSHDAIQLAGCSHGRSYGYGPSYYPSYRPAYYGGYGGYGGPSYYGGHSHYGRSSYYGGYGGGYGYPSYYGGRSGVSLYIGF